MTVLKYIARGLGIGSTIYLISGLIYTSGTIQHQIFSILLLSALLGVYPLIYLHEKLSLFTQALIHLGLSYFSFLGTAYLGQWFPMKIGIIVTASLTFFIIFIFIWFLYYHKEKKKIASLNKKLKLKKDNSLNS